MADNSRQMPVVENDPTSPAFVSNPYDFYRRLRAMRDVVYWKDYGIAVATTQSAVSRFMKHPKFGRAPLEDARSSTMTGLDTWNERESHSLLELEPPDHTRIRRMAMKGFDRSRMAQMAPTISQIADSLIDQFPSGPFDLIQFYAKPLTAKTITRFIGIDEVHAEQMQTWSSYMVAMYQARRDHEVEKAAETAAQEFSAFVLEEIRARQGRPREDFLSQLTSAQMVGAMTEAELISTVILLLNAGHESTAHSIGNAVNLLNSFPERSVALHPDNIATTVEECLRYAPPLHMFKRYAYAPVKLFDVEFQPGDQIGCLLGSACRDDAVWPDGDKFDPFRPRWPHMAFGSGLHTCIGSSLARLEMQIVLPALFSRCPNLRIVEPPRIANLYHFHGLEQLMITV